MTTLLADTMAACAPHGAAAQPIAQLAQWLASTGRVQTNPTTEGDPETYQAYLWPQDTREAAPTDGTEHALASLVIRPGGGEDLSYWMAPMPPAVIGRLSSIGHDNTMGPDGFPGPITGFALWTPQGGVTQIVHVATPGAVAAPIGTPTDFLRALSLPIVSLSDALTLGHSAPSQPNDAYRDWLRGIGLPPADTLEDALPTLQPPDADAFRDWLRATGYKGRYFLTGQL